MNSVKQKKITDVLSEDAIRTINKDMKFFGTKELDKVKMGIGMETLWLVSMINNETNQRKENNPKGLMKVLDLLDSMYKMNITTFTTMIKMKNSLLGKDYVKKCCYYAIFRCYANDIDLVESLESMYSSTKKLKHKNNVPELSLGDAEK